MSASRGYGPYTYGGDNVRKEEMVNRINDLLEMEHRLSVWQFPSIRKYELEEMVTRIESLYQRAYGRPYEPPTVLRETAYGKRPAYRTQYDIRHREEGTQPPLMS